MIARRDGLGVEAFLHDYMGPGRPVVATDATWNWAALTRWTPEFFEEQYGSREFTVNGQRYTLRELIDQARRSTPDDAAPHLHNEPLARAFPELMSDIRPLPYSWPNWLESRLFPTRHSPSVVEVFIGGRGARFPVLHYDVWHMHAFLSQIHGEKEVVLFAPEDGRYLYPRDGRYANHSMVDDIDHPDLERFPLFVRAQPWRCTLGPGDTLFIPSGWWHTTRMVGLSIMVSVNTANGVNWRAFVADYCADAAEHRSPTYVRVLSLYLAALGKVKHAMAMTRRLAGLRAPASRR
jgi:histone arginine demethylase JMJD6